MCGLKTWEPIGQCWASAGSAAGSGLVSASGLLKSARAVLQCLWMTGTGCTSAGTPGGSGLIVTRHDLQDFLQSACKRQAAWTYDYDDYDQHTRSRSGREVRVFFVTMQFPIVGVVDK
ncbi:hypothetical protein ACJQWK_06729 [Exserohilum turcicum]